MTCSGLRRFDRGLGRDVEGSVGTGPRQRPRRAGLRSRELSPWKATERSDAGHGGITPASTTSAMSAASAWASSAVASSTWVLPGASGAWQLAQAVGEHGHDLVRERGDARRGGGDRGRCRCRRWVLEGGGGPRTRRRRRYLGGHGRLAPVGGIDLCRGPCRVEVTGRRGVATAACRNEEDAAPPRARPGRHRPGGPSVACDRRVNAPTQRYTSLVDRRRPWLAPAAPSRSGP